VDNAFVNQIADVPAVNISASDDRGIRFADHELSAKNDPITPHWPGLARDSRWWEQAIQQHQTNDDLHSASPQVI
jgi:hypothetical protein